MNMLHSLTRPYANSFINYYPISKIKHLNVLSIDMKLNIFINLLIEHQKREKKSNPISSLLFLDSLFPFPAKKKKKKSHENVESTM